MIKIQSTSLVLLRTTWVKGEIIPVTLASLTCRHVPSAAVINFSFFDIRDMIEKRDSEECHKQWQHGNKEQEAQPIWLISAQVDTGRQTGTDSQIRLESAWPRI